MVMMHIYEVRPRKDVEKPSMSSGPRSFPSPKTSNNATKCRFTREERPKRGCRKYPVAGITGAFASVTVQLRFCCHCGSRNPAQLGVLRVAHVPFEKRSTANCRDRIAQRGRRLLLVTRFGHPRRT